MSRSPLHRASYVSVPSNAQSCIGIYSRVHNHRWLDPIQLRNGLLQRAGIPANPRKNVCRSNKSRPIQDYGHGDQGAIGPVLAAASNVEQAFLLLAGV